MAERPRMSGLFDRWSLSIALFFVSIKLLQYLRRLGLRPRQDGFRRSTRAFLRVQESHPCMPVFGLRAAGPKTTRKAPNDLSIGDCVVARLQEFLASRPDMRKCLRWGRFQTKIVERTALDVVQADVDASGSLVEIRPYLDPRVPLDVEQDYSAAARRALLRAFNEMRLQSDKQRPVELQHELLRQVRAIAGTSRADQRSVLELADRFSSAIWVYLETLPISHAHAGKPDPHARIQPPAFRERLGPGPGGFVVTARILPDGKAVDLWFHYSHSLFDGVPFAEMLLDLEKEWGVVAPLVLPAPEPAAAPRPQVLCSGPGVDVESWVLADWLDFAPLLSRRNQLEARLAERLKGERISTVGLLVWGLAQHDVCRDLKFTVVLDMPAAGKRERSLGIAPIRPSVFFDDHDPDGAFVAFNSELLRRIRATRERRSESYEMVESIALLPASLYPLALRLFGAGIRECVGTIGISIIRESPVVIAAQTDIHIDGFLGIGGFDLPDEDGGLVGVVAVKGPPSKIDSYLDALRAWVA